jgi:hypothetical protein
MGAAAGRWVSEDRARLRARLRERLQSVNMKVSVCYLFPSWMPAYAGLIPSSISIAAVINLRHCLLLYCLMGAAVRRCVSEDRARLRARLRENLMRVNVKISIHYHASGAAYAGLISCSTAVAITLCVAVVTRAFWLADRLDSGSGKGSSTAPSSLVHFLKPEGHLTSSFPGLPVL